MPELSVVGKRLSRVDGIEKVTGQGLFTMDIYPPGLLWGVELVKDRATREPFVPEDRHTLQAGKKVKKFSSNLIKEKCAEKGVLMGGLAPNALRIYPGLTISREEIDQGIEALDYAFSELDRLCE